MRDPKRIKRIITLLEVAWEQCPDLRLTQLIMNALGTFGDPYNIEDDILEEKLKNFIKAIGV